MLSTPSFLRPPLALRALAASVAATLALGAALPAPAQDAPKRESVTIEAYTGPPVYLPETDPPPPPRRVESRVIKENFPDSETPRFERGVARFSDDSIVSDGSHKEYFSNGQLYVEGAFKLGKATGTWVYHHANGQVAKEVTYVDGKPDGEVKVYNEEGKLIQQRQYDAGRRTGSWLTYSDEGEQKLVEQSYADGKLEGPVRTWYSNGQLRQESRFVNGKREGIAQEWTLNGEKRAELNFKEGKRDGKATVWQRDGRIIEQTYEAGRLVDRSERQAN